MANVKISQLPSWTGSSADLRWFVMNNSGETETFKFSGYTSPFKVGNTINSIVSVNLGSDKVAGPNDMLQGLSNQIQTTGGQSTILGGESNTITSAASGYNTIIGSLSSIVNSNFGASIYSSRNSTVGGYFSIIMGANEASNTGGRTSAIIGGENITLSGQYTVSLGGRVNTINGERTAVIAGENNLTNNIFAGGIFVGTGNKIYGGNDQGFFIGGSISNVIASNGGQGIFAIGGQANRIQNFRSTVDAGRSVYGGILGGQSNYIGSSRANADNSTSGQNAFPLILGGFFNTILGAANGAGNPNFYSSIINSNNCIISSGSTGATIINSVNSSVSGRTNVVMLGTSGRTATADSTTFVENLVIFNYSNLNFVDDAAAAAGGVVLGEVYHNNGALRIRIA